MHSYVHDAWYKYKKGTTVFRIEVNSGKKGKKLRSRKVHKGFLLY